MSKVIFPILENLNKYIVVLNKQKKDKSNNEITIWRYQYVILSIITITNDKKIKSEDPTIVICQTLHQSLVEGVLFSVKKYIL